MIVLYDDARARAFEPFATTRPLGEVRAGALLGRERWAMFFGASADAFIGGSHLAHFAEFDAPGAASLPLPAGAWLVNTRALPVPVAVPLPGAPGADVIRIDGQVAAICLRVPLQDRCVLDGSLTLEALVPSDAVEAAVTGVWLHDTWDIIRHLTTQLQDDIPAIASTLGIRALSNAHSLAGVVIRGDAPVFVEDGATIEPFVVFDTSSGPVLLRRGATVHAFTRVVGPCYVGLQSTLMTDRIAASSIGDMCRVHGELSMSVFIGHANKGHDGFVGHSILGRWVNLGAGTTTSNLKNSYGTVAVWSTSGVRDTGLQFAGTFFGDHVKTGIGLRLTTGCVLGAGTNVMDAMPPKVVAPFSWGTGAPYEVFATDKFLETATRMMARRGIALDAHHRRFIDDVITHALADSRWPSR